MGKADTWAALLEAAQAQKAVQVSLPAEARAPSRRRPGRPRTRGATRFGHYAGYRPEKGGRPKCALRGCARQLRRDQRLGCCPDHEAKAVADALGIVAKVRGDEAA